MLLSDESVSVLFLRERSFVYLVELTIFVYSNIFYLNIFLSSFLALYF
jgi:hypothetical protein